MSKDNEPNEHKINYLAQWVRGPVDVNHKNWGIVAGVTAPAGRQNDCEWQYFNRIIT